MASKSKKKKLREAHAATRGASSSSLPPPPATKDLTAVSAKLRRIMAFRQADAEQKEMKAQKSAIAAQRFEEKARMNQAEDSSSTKENFVDQEAATWAEIKKNLSSTSADAQAAVGSGSPENVHEGAEPETFRVDTSRGGGAVEGKDGVEKKRKRERGEGVSEIGGSEGGAADSVGEEEGVEKEEKKEKKKRRRMERWEVAALAVGDGDSKAKKSRLSERKRRYLETKKKKSKNKGGVQNDDFEDVRPKVIFGDVVLAPPKMLPNLRKKNGLQSALKSSVESKKEGGVHHWPEAMGDKATSKERLRQTAVDLYRKKRKWEMRPGGAVLPESLAELD